MDIEQAIEFEVNDIVTFKAYEKAIKAKVLRVYRGFGFFNDLRVTYELSGVSESLTGHCTGNSIMESIYFKCLINGFVFNPIGDLIEQPKKLTDKLLNETYKELISNKEYNKAFRINHLMEVK